MYPHIRRIKSPIPPIRPLWRCLTDVVLRTKFFPSLEQFKEAFVIDMGVPFAVDEEAVRCDQNTTTVYTKLAKSARTQVRRKGSKHSPMCVFCCNPITQSPSLQLFVQRFHKLDNLLIKWHVLHRQPRLSRRRGTAVRHTLHLHKPRKTLLDKIRISHHLVVNIETFDERQPEYCSLRIAFFAQDFKARLKALPEVAVKRPVDFFETVAVRRVDGDVELCYVAEGGELCGVLGITDEEGRDFAGVE